MTGKSDSHLMSFKKTADNEWKSKGINRGFQGTITFVDAPATNRYTLVIDPGAITSAYSSLHKSKNAFRKFLLDKPVT